MLLAQGVDANGSTEGGQTPLIRAAIFGHTEIVQLLLEAGANPLAKDSRGLSAIDWAARRGFSELSDLMANAPLTHTTFVNSDALLNRFDQQTEPREQSLTKLSASDASTFATPTSTSGANITSDEKSRRWIAGVRQRLREEEKRKLQAVDAAGELAPKVKESEVKEEAAEQGTSETLPEYAKDEGTLRLAEQSARAKLRLESQRILEEARQRIDATLADKIVKEPGGILRELPSDEFIVSPESQEEQNEHKTAGISAEAVTTEPVTATPNDSSLPGRKRCPKCNGIFESELLAYCAYDATPLVDADAVPVFLAVPPETPTRSMVWVLIAITLIGSASLTLLFTTFFRQPEEGNTPVLETVIPAAATQPDKPMVGGELTGKELEVPLADYPQQARDAGIKGDVTVRVRVNGRGQVISVRAGNGEQPLRRAALSAARKATFDPEKLNGRATTGTITYSFK